MTDVPAWPGVTEYLYQAASLASVVSEGTWIEPSAPRPRCSSFDWTPMAGMETDTGSDWRSDGPFTTAGVTFPAADSAGAGACRWESSATAMTARPPTMREKPANPVSLMREVPRGGGLGANWLSGQDMTTRNPATRVRFAGLSAGATSGTAGEPPPERCPGGPLPI